jgi:hypothetical protein
MLGMLSESTIRSVRFGEGLVSWLPPPTVANVVGGGRCLTQAYRGMREMSRSNNPVFFFVNSDIMCDWKTKKMTCGITGRVSQFTIAQNRSVTPQAKYSMLSNFLSNRANR